MTGKTRSSRRRMVTSDRVNASCYRLDRKLNQLVWHIHHPVDCLIHRIHWSCPDRRISQFFTIGVQVNVAVDANDRRRKPAPTLGEIFPGWIGFHHSRSSFPIGNFFSYPPNL